MTLPDLNKKKILLICIFLIAYPDNALAIPPPEIVRIGSIAVQILSFFIVFFSTLIFFIRKQIKIFLISINVRQKVLLGGAALAGSLLLVWGPVYWSKLHSQKLNSAGNGIRNAVTVGDGVLFASGMELDIADTSLKMEPRDVAKVIGNKDYMLIDIREPIEFSIRHVPGFTNIRIGDLVAGRLYKGLDRNKTIILICEAGERASAVAVFLKVRGYDARFVSTGIGKWNAKDIKLSGPNRVSLPDYNNRDTILSRRSVNKLLGNGKAFLIDVRAPGEFQKEHVSGAHNISLINLPTRELEKALDSIPRDKVAVGIAYDRFGDFYLQILGYMLDKKKRPYAGTVRAKDLHD